MAGLYWNIPFIDDDQGGTPKLQGNPIDHHRLSIYIPLVVPSIDLPFTIDRIDRQGSERSVRDCARVGDAKLSALAVMGWPFLGGAVGRYKSSRGYFIMGYIQYRL